MINKQIQTLQGELNQLVAKNVDYRKIYELSVRLDELIVKYYRKDKKSGK